MNTCLKIGSHLLTGEQLVSALVRYKLLETLISQVVLDDILHKVRLTQKEVVQVLTGSSQVPEDFETFLNQWCQNNRVTPVYVKAVMLREAQVKKLKTLLFTERLETEFLRRKHQLDQVEFSRIQLNNLALAEELYFQLRDDGADFSVLSQQHSFGFERYTGGLVGPVSFTSLPDKVVNLFRGGQAGQLFEPIQFEESFWILRLERVILARLNESVRAELIECLFSDWLQSQVRLLTSRPDSIEVLRVLNGAAGGTTS